MCASEGTSRGFFFRSFHHCGLLFGWEFEDDGSWKVEFLHWGICTSRLAKGVVR